MLFVTANQLNVKPLQFKSLSFFLNDARRGHLFLVLSKPLSYPSLSYNAADLISHWTEGDNEFSVTEQRLQAVTVSVYPTSILFSRFQWDLNLLGTVAYYFMRAT